MPAYEDLRSRFYRMAALQQAASVLQWDLATLMPKGGAAARTEQLAALELTCHEMLTEPRVAEDLAAAEA